MDDQKMEKGLDENDPGPAPRAIKFVWYGGANAYTIGQVEVAKDGLITGQISSEQVISLVHSGVIVEMGFAAKADTPLVPEESESLAVRHARRELEIIGEDPDVIEWYLDVVRTFHKFGHSGGSAMATIPVVVLLLSMQNLSPITDYPDDWYHHEAGDYGVAEDIWQCKRNSACFSTDGGKTYYELTGNGRSPVIQAEKDKRSHG